jgi:PPK2 family polyphosphate:nucleotide phosphotransferase
MYLTISGYDRQLMRDRRSARRTIGRIEQTMLKKNFGKTLIAPTDGSFKLAHHDPSWEGSREIKFLSEKQLKKRTKTYLKDRRAELIVAQEKLYADNRHSLLIIFQAMDAAGKDGTIKHVMSGVNPQGCQVFSFKKPSERELDHNFLWRYWQTLPERGRIGIFNRSYYEDVLVVQVHPELITRVGITDGLKDKNFWAGRYEDINAFERHLTRNGTTILKFFLNVSKNEQRNRFINRLTDPDRLWKFSTADLDERGHWDNYQRVYNDVIANTSTNWAPWHIIPADNKWLMRALVITAITEAIGGLDLEFPKVPPAQMKEFRAALKTLRAEKN